MQENIKLKKRTFVFTSIVDNDSFKNHPIKLKGVAGKQDDTIGTTKGGVVPGSQFTWVPDADPKTHNMRVNTSFIEECGGTLNYLVKSMGYTSKDDSGKEKLIKETTLDATDDFWAHYDYSIELNSEEEGPVRLTTDVPEHLLAIATAMESRFFYVEGYGGGRPPNLSQVVCHVVEEGKQSVKVLGGKMGDAGILMRNLIEAPMETKMFAAEVLALPYGDEVTEKDLDNLIFNNVLRDDSRLVFGQETAYTFLDKVLKMKSDAILTVRMVNSLKWKQVFTMGEDNYYTIGPYKVGRNHMEIAEYIKNPENEQVFQLVAQKAKEHGFKF